MSISEDRLITSLESKQDSLLPVKQGLYSNNEGDNDDLCVCTQNGKYYLGIKISNQWRYVSINNADKLASDDSSQSQIRFESDNVVKSNFNQYLSMFRDEILNLLAGATRLGSWSVHHGFSGLFGDGSDFLPNYLQYSAGDRPETNTSSSRIFIVPFASILKKINFYMIVASASSGSDVVYQFSVVIKKGDTSSSLATVKTETLTVTVLDGEQSGFGMIYPNVNMVENEFYEVSVTQTSPATLALKTSKAVSYFQATWM